MPCSKSLVETLTCHVYSRHDDVPQCVTTAAYNAKAVIPVYSTQHTV